MKKILAILLSLIFSVSFVNAASYYSPWDTKGTYIKTNSPLGYNVLINGTSKYLNFNSISGSTGYGFRDSAGTMQYKNLGGSWAEIGSGAGSGITSLAGQSGSTQTFSTSTPPTGLDFKVVSDTNDHEFQLGISSGYIIPTSTDYSNWYSAFNITNDGTYTDTKYCTWDTDHITCTSEGGSGGVFTTSTINGLTTTTFVIATSSDTNLGFEITTSSVGLTFIPTWIGTLADGRIANASSWNTAYGWGDWNGNIDISTDTNLTASNGIQLDGDDIKPAVGYEIPLTASSTDWTTAYDTVNASSTYWDTAYEWGDWSGEGFLKNVSEDLTPTLGGTLDADSKSITNYFGSACASGNAMYDIADDGTFSCRAITSGGGSGLWATNTAETIIYPTDTAYGVVIGANATTVQDVDLEVAGDIVADGILSTSTLEVYGTSTLATTTATQFTFTNGSSTNFTVSGSLWADLTGNADTATALASAPSQCTAGSYPLGVDVSGDVQNCTDASTEIDSIVATHTADADAHQALVTLAGEDYLSLSTQQITANEIDLTDNVTGLLPDGNISSATIWNALDTASSSWSNAADFVHATATEDVIGLEFSTQELQLTSTYLIPTSTDYTNWYTAFNWGDWNGNVDISTDTNLAVSGTLLDLTDDTLSINEGTLTDTKYCTYESGTGIQCTSEGGSGGSFTTTSINNTATTTFTFATSSDTNIGLEITTSTDTITFIPTWIGTLADARITSGVIWTALDTASSSWNTAYGWGDWNGNIDISTDTNLSGDTEIVLTGDVLSIGSAIARDTELHDAVTLAGEDYLSLSGQEITAANIDLTDNVTGLLPDANIASNVIWNALDTASTTWTAKQDALAFGIADTNSVVIDDADAADNDFAKFTASGLEGRSYAEVKTDLTLNLVENTAISTWVGSANITTLGTIGTGVWNGTALTDAYVSDDITVNGYMQDTDINTFAKLQAWVSDEMILASSSINTYAELNTIVADQTLAYSGGAFHDGFSDFVANEHIDWTTDQGATNIHSGNYTDTNTTYTGGTNLTLAGTVFSVDDAFIVNDANDTMVGVLTADGLTLGQDENITLGSQTLDHDGTDFVFNDSLSITGNAYIGGSNNELRFYEGANYVGFEAPALTADRIWVLPSADGTANQIIETDGSGALTWVDKPTSAATSSGAFLHWIVGDTDDGIQVFEFEEDSTITGMLCRTYKDGTGTTTITLVHEDDDALDSMICGYSTSTDDDGSIANASFDAGEAVFFNTSNTTGTPANVFYKFLFTID